MRIWCRVNKKHVFCCNCQLSVINFLMRCRIFRTDWSYRLIIIHEKLKDTSYRELNAWNRFFKAHWSKHIHDPRLRMNGQIDCSGQGTGGEWRKRREITKCREITEAEFILQHQQFPSWSRTSKPGLLLNWATTALALGEDFWLSPSQVCHISWL